MLCGPALSLVDGPGTVLGWAVINIRNRGNEMSWHGELGQNLNPNNPIPGSFCQPDESHFL
jgi:hypothetical protein